tara:strand:+ start:1465 stop:2061 length:597 start_codon:yes stop_codon:yes gene_type:complete
MKIIITLITFIFSIIFCLDLKKINSLDYWETLQKHPARIEWCEYNGFPIAKSEKILNHNIDSIAMVIRNLEGYPKVFKRVKTVKKIEPDVVHIVVDMPFPFDGRDYVIKYEIEKSKSKWIFSFSSTSHPMAFSLVNHVRLPNAAGVWFLNRLTENTTMVTYAWNGELLGNFPEMGLHKAWITQGNEVLEWLSNSLNKR